MRSDEPMPGCGKFVSWWDGEYEGWCELPLMHDGPHFDGMSWYDDDSYEVSEPSDSNTE